MRSGQCEGSERLAERQEHGQREGPFDANDARRCVFYTGLVMYELDHTLE